MSNRRILLQFSARVLLVAAAGFLPTALSAAPQANTAPAAPSLKVGDPAPVFKVGRWVKGGPLQALKKGEVYVVECWATWCGPCKAAMPHLTELAHAYKGKVTVIGVDVLENGDPKTIDAKVDALVKAMGDKMDYLVCRDSADKHMEKNWLKASGTGGIPHSIIVDREGRIAYLGHPMGLDEVLSKVVAGTHDMKAAGAADDARKKERMAFVAAWEEVRPAIEKAVVDKDWAQVLTLVDQAEAKHPMLGNGKQAALTATPRFQAYAATDSAKARAFLGNALKVDATPDELGVAIKLLMAVWDMDSQWAALAVEVLDRAASIPNANTKQIKLLRFEACLRCDPTKAKGFWDGDDCQKDPLMLMGAAGAIADCPKVDPTWCGLALPILEGALKNSEFKGYATTKLPRVYFGLGRAKEAVALQEQAIAEMRAAGYGANVGKMEKDLKTFRDAVK